MRRSSDAADKRAKVVTATDEGVRALATGEQSGAEILRTIFERLSPEQVKALNEILDVLD